MSTNLAARRRPPRVWAAAATALLLLGGPAAARAQGVAVRGRLQRPTPSGTFPLANVCVTAFNPVVGRSQPSCTGPDGMYYLYGVPPGQYVLEVWVASPPGVGQPRAFSVVIGAPRNQPTWDLPPLNL